MNRIILLSILSLAAQSLSAIDDAPADGSRYPIPTSKYDVRLDKNQRLSMRDGTRLSTDLYFPVGAGDKLPVILIRTPYGKKNWRQNGRFGPVTSMFAGHGYVVAVQDKRGRYQSEGKYSLAIKEDDDGYDTIDWLANQKWSSGRIGTYGCSDRGDSQVWVAPTLHPNLKAMIPQASGSSLGSAGKRYRYFGSFNGGAFHLGAAYGWMLRNGTKVFWQAPSWLPDNKFRELADYFEGRPIHAPQDFKHEDIMRSLPVADMMDKVNRSYTDWRDILNHDLGDPWWDQFPYYKGDEKVDVPTLFVNSWHDFGVNETLFQFTYFKEHSLSQKSKDNQYVIISPATHCKSELITAPTVVGERELGDARLNFWKVYLDWFDHWLKDVDNKITSMPAVQYYLMGKNQWKSADNWPVPDTRFTRYYLHSKGSANSRFGDGRLSTDAPKLKAQDNYTYDPASPVPSGSGSYNLGDGYFDQREIETRPDVLVYTSDVLSRGIEVTGPIKALLYVSSSVRDTDFTAKLVDVYPDGRAFYIQEGILRARYRNGFESRAWMEKGKVYALEISLDASSNYFATGHRIRLEVSSSNFPRFDRNLNTGGDNFNESEWLVADNVIHHSHDKPSHILLPIVERDED